MIKDSAPGTIITIGRFANKEIISSKLNIPIISIGNPEPGRQQTEGGLSTRVIIKASFLEQLTLLKKAYPSIKSLGMIYSSDNDDVYQSAQEAAIKSGLQLIGVKVKNTNDIPSAYNTIKGKIGALWLIIDKVVIDGLSLRFFVEQSMKDRIITFGEMDSFVKIGVLCAPKIDSDNIAETVAEIANSQQDQKVYYVKPAGLIYNRGTFENLGKIAISDKGVSVTFIQ